MILFHCLSCSMLVKVKFTKMTHGISMGSGEDFVLMGAVGQIGHGGARGPRR